MRVLPPRTGSPLRFWCSRISRERRFGLVRGIGDTELTMTLTFGDGKHANSQPPTKIAVTLVGLAPSATDRHFCRDPDFVGYRGAIDRLKDQLEIEGEFQFAHHHHRRIIVTHPDKVAAADFALYRIAGIFKEGFHRVVEGGFHAGTRKKESSGDHTARRCRITTPLENRGAPPHLRIITRYRWLAAVVFRARCCPGLQRALSRNGSSALCVSARLILRSPETHSMGLPPAVA